MPLRWPCIYCAGSISQQAIKERYYVIQLEERIKGEEWVAVETFGGVSSNEVRDTAIELAYYAEESEVRNELIKQIKEER